MLFGMFAALSLPPLYVLPGLLGFAGWLWFLMKVTSRRSAFLTGWSFGLGYFIVGLYWIAIAFFTDAEKFGALAVPAIILLSAVMAVFPGFAGLALGLLRPRHPVAAAIALAMAWAIAEWLRAHFLWGFPWNLIGYVWIGVLPMSQVAAWIGIYGLGVLTVLIGALFITVLTFADRLRWVGPASSIAMIILLAIGGMARLAGGDVEHQPDVHLRLVQANIAQHHKWDPELRAESFRQHLAQTISPEARPATHVIWPETASAYILDEDEGAREAIADVTPLDGFLITGFNRFDFESEPKRAWNSLAAIDSEGTITSIYDKQRLVPFGEFLPWRHILSRIGLKKITAGTVDFQPGPGPTTMTLDGLPPFSPLICYEVIFTGDVVNPSDRPAWLLNITNDAWFGQSTGPYQHLAMARMRAIEEGLPLARSANTGISAIVDPFGRIEVMLGLGETGVLDAPLPKPLSQPTFYAVWGQTVFLLMVAMCIMIIFMIEKLFKN
jgi:apolipoprotein N-acyltransferase